MQKKKFIVATRPSLLATAQTEQIVELLRKKNPGIDFEIIKFSTQGDKVTDKPLLAFGGTGVFVKELENAILEGKADFAVHSLKDVPSFVPEELTLASFPLREDVRDVFLSANKGLNYRDIKESKIKIGTGSPRRILQLKEMFVNAEFADLRGNIETRIRKMEEGQYDGIVLASAGMKRLGKNIPEESYINTEDCIPAIGQGAIGIECRKDDKETIEIVRSINDTTTEMAVKAERSYMIVMEGNCKFPLAAYAKIKCGSIMISAMVGNPETGKIIRKYDSFTLRFAEEGGRKLAERVRKEALEIGIL